MHCCDVPVPVCSGEKGNGACVAKEPVDRPESRRLPARGDDRRAATATLSRDTLDASPAYIVGVGASAGGLEAFTELLSHLPDDTGMAFVLIQHLDPSHESHLTELLSKASKMPVSEVNGETRAEANHVYVIPPRCNLSISDGVLHTPPRPASGRNMPIDAFLRALAADRGSKALGVVLSGTASDGTLGLQAIKAAGGITFAQEVRTAKFDGMPRSAIAAGVVDFVLPPAGIARQLVAIARDSRVPIEPREAIEPPEDAELAKILRLVRSATGVDFTHYKPSTLARRIKRRMTLRGFENAGRLQPGSRAEPRGSQRAVRELSDHRHGILSGTGGLRGTEDEGVPRSGRESGARGSHPDLGARVRHGRGGLFDRHLLDGIPGRGEGRAFRSRFSPPISAKRRSKRPAPAYTRTPRWRMSRRSDWRASSPDRNAGTRSRRPSATYAFLPGTTWPRTRLSPSWTSSVAATC